MAELPRRARSTRRDFLRTAGLAAGVGSIVSPARLWRAWAQGLKTPDFVVPGGGAKVVQALAAGQVLFALADSNHPLKIPEKGKDALMIFATDTRCSYANVVARKELFDKGVKTVEALADEKLVGRKAVIAATAIGSGTHVYGVYVLKNTKAADGKPVNDHVEWVGGGASTTMLGGLRRAGSTRSWPCPNGSPQPWKRASVAPSSTSPTRRRGTASSAGPSR